MRPSCEDGGHLARLRLINLASPQGRDCHSEKLGLRSDEEYEILCRIDFFKKPRR